MIDNFKPLFNYLFLYYMFFSSYSIYAQNDIHNYQKMELQNDFKKSYEIYEEFEKEHGHFIQTPNTYMHYLTWGKITDTPLIWIHGSFNSSYEIREVVDEIVNAGYYVIAIDYYGHGKTNFPKQNVSIYNVVDDIRFLMDKLEINKAIIGGFSMGGTIATAFYDEYASKTLGIILENGGSACWLNRYQNIERHIVDKNVNEMYKWIRADTLFDSISEAFEYYRDKKNTAYKEFWLFNSIKEDKNGLWGYNYGLRNWLDQSTPESYIKSIYTPTSSSLFISSLIMLQPNVIYRNLNVPLLIFDSQNDDNNDWDFNDNINLKQSHPYYIDHIIYEKTGHGLHFKHPKRFIEDVLSFLQKVKNYHAL